MRQPARTTPVAVMPWEQWDTLGLMEQLGVVPTFKSKAAVA
jgi:hypothetical protein